MININLLDFGQLSCLNGDHTINLTIYNNINKHDCTCLIKVQYIYKILNEYNFHPIHIKEAAKLGK